MRGWGSAFNLLFAIFLEVESECKDDNYGRYDVIDTQKIYNNFEHTFEITGGPS